MLQLLSRGWKLVLHNKSALTVVSLYQLGWTLLLFFLTERIVTPLVRALPNSSVNQNAPYYYWTEMKFMAAKTDMLMPYLYTLVGLLLLRMIIAPFVQSGIFGTLANSNQQAEHNKFIAQIKSNWKAFTLLYWIKSIAIIVPAVIVFTPIVESLIQNYFTLNVKDIPWLAVSLLIIWSILVKSLTYSLQIGITMRISWQKSLLNLVKKVLMLIAVLVTIMIISSALHGILQVSSLFVASFISSIIFFISPILQTFMKAWTISTHTIQFSE